MSKNILCFQVIVLLIILIKKENLVWPPKGLCFLLSMLDYHKGLEFSEESYDQTVDYYVFKLPQGSI